MLESPQDLFLGVFLFVIINKNSMKLVYKAIAVLAVFAALTPSYSQKKSKGENTKFKSWAQKPPMGWNSYDAYHGAVTEKQFLSSVDVLEKKLLAAGYDVATIDFCWFNPGPKDWNPDNWKTFPLKQLKDDKGNLTPIMTMDKFGRLLPAVNRFPSAKNNAGFKNIADYVHAKKMKFAIHIMRGIARQAVALNTPIKNSKYFAKDIAKVQDTCKWNNNMYGVDPTKPGAQEYYNSLFELYAQWGVDFVKVDDISAPTYHAKEIELIRKAIDRCGRPMVLSLSCGETMVSYANHLEKNANMYRISIDFWDKWKSVAHMFDLAYAWQPLINQGTWPDLDMIPIGNLCIGDYPLQEEGSDKTEHVSRLTTDEQKTLMTLWCFAKSPLIWGGDPLSSKPEDFEMISNKNLIDIDQNSTNNHQIANFVYEGMQREDRIWTAESKDGKERYVAFFNLGEKTRDLSFYFQWEYWDGTYEFVDLWTNETVGSFPDVFTAKNIPAHGVKAFKMIKK